MTDSDYYDLLGLTRGADDAAIKSAYRRLAKECHPDRHGGCSDQEARFKAISEAYECLKDPQKRAAYDRFGKAAFQNGGDPFGGGGAGFEGFSDIFSSIFGEFMDPRGQRQNAARGADLRYDLELRSKRRRGTDHFRSRLCAGDPARQRSPRQSGAKTRALQRAGKVRAQQGFFSSSGCPNAAAAGMVADPCTSCEAKAARSDAAPVGQNPRGVDWHPIRVSARRVGVRNAHGDLYSRHMKRMRSSERGNGSYRESRDLHHSGDRGGSTCTGSTAPG